MIVLLNYSRTCTRRQTRQGLREDASTAEFPLDNLLIILKQDRRTNEFSRRIVGRVNVITKHAALQRQGVISSQIRVDGPQRNLSIKQVRVFGE